MSNRRKQYLIKQFSLSDIINENSTFSISSEGVAAKQSENFLFHMIVKMQNIESGELNDIISIKSGRNVLKEKKETLAGILNGGVTIGDKKYVFLDCSLSSSQHKQRKQYYINEQIYAKVMETITLGKKPALAVSSKYLTAVALMTTSCNLFNISDYIDNLDICVIPDLEYEIRGQKIVYKEDYHRTPEEEVQYQTYLKQLEEQREYQKALSDGKTKAEQKKISKREKGNMSTEKTSASWEKEGFQPQKEQADKPVSRVWASNIRKWRPCYTREQCEPITEFEFPVNRLTTGVDFIEDVKNVPINFADGTALMDESFAKRLSMSLTDEGGQLRFPYCKAFFSIIKLREWLKAEGSVLITDIFGDARPSDKIDILMTKSCFKAFLEKSEPSTNTEGCLFQNMAEYKQLIKKYGFDLFGVANYVHVPHFKYTKITYQMLLALNIKGIDLMMFAQDECEMINKAISIYSSNGQANWYDAHYLLAFLNMLHDEKNTDDNDQSEDENDVESDDEDVPADMDDTENVELTDTNAQWEEPVIQAIRLNKNMVFDPYVMKKILDRINYLINEMRLGKIYMPCNYYFATCHIPTLIDWAIHRDIKRINKMVPKEKAYMGTKSSLYVGMRNPVTSYSEATKISFEADTCKWTNHLRHVIQFGEGLFMPQMNMDYDGDKICLFSTEKDYKQAEVSWPVFYKGEMILSEDGKDEIDTYESIQESKQKRLEELNPQGKVTFADFVVKSLLQIDFADKATTEPVEFNKQAVIGFILNADDKTGQITDKTSQAENRLIAEQKLDKYEYAIRYGKYLQGLQIDASKSGLPVTISESFQYNYQRKPQFLRYRCGGKEYLYDQDYKSPLDWFAKDVLANYQKWVKEQINKNTHDRKEAQHIYNTTALLLSPNLNCDVVREYEKKLEPEYLTYRSEFKAIHAKYKMIDQYSKSDDAKERRKLKRQEYSDLNQKMREQIYQLCPNQSVVAQVAVNYAYKYSKENSGDTKNLRWQDNWNFAWMFPEGLLYHLWLNQDEEKIDVIRSDERSNYDLVLLDSYFTTSFVKRSYGHDEIKEIDGIDVPQEYLAREPESALELKNVMCKGLNTGLTIDDISERLFVGAVLALVKVNGYTQLWDEKGKIIGINYESLEQYSGGRVVVQRIFNQKRRTVQIDCSVEMSDL